MDRSAAGGKQDASPISDYGAIGNTVTGALVSHSGSIDWCCLPRFDSPSTFAAILDPAKGGFFAIRPTADYRSSQRYIFDTNILVTAFESSDGTSAVELIDFMIVPKDASAEHPTEIHRLVGGVRGQMEMEIVFSPRFDNGRTMPKLKLHRHGIVANAHSSSLGLATGPLSFRIEGDSAVARLTAKEGDVAPVVLVYREKEPKGVTDYYSLDRLSEVQTYWRDWVGRHRYQGGWRDLVMRSSLLIKLLTPAQAGVPVAALTTSLPRAKERAGSVFDGRHPVVQCSSRVLMAMLNAGFVEEETKLLVSAIIELDGARTVKLTTMHPAGRLHLTSYGEILYAWRVYRHRTGSIPTDVQGKLQSMADSIVRHWTEPDVGRWEEDGERRQYSYSKVMCAVGLDAAIALAENFGLRGDVQTWRKTSESIREEVMTKGWSEKRQSFVKYFGDDKLDASSLLFPLYGFIQADDPRMKSTVDQIVRNLGVDGLLRRFDGDVSAFPICSLWLAQCYLKMGDIKKAEQVFGRIVDLSNHLSLYSEAVDSKTHEFLGNFPDTLTHAEFINVAFELSSRGR